MKDVRSYQNGSNDFLPIAKASSCEDTQCFAY